MKDKEWLRGRIKVFQEGENMFTAEFNAGVQQALEYVQELIDQLDEPEVTLDRAFEKVAESYPMTKEEIWRHLERLVAHGGKVTYGEPEVEQLDKKIRELESYNDELIRDNNQLRNELNNQEVLSQEWIDENKETKS